AQREALGADEGDGDVEVRIPGPLLVEGEGRRYAFDAVVGARLAQDRSAEGRRVGLRAVHVVARARSVPTGTPRQILLGGQAPGERALRIVAALNRREVPE